MMLRGVFLVLMMASAGVHAANSGVARTLQAYRWTLDEATDAQRARIDALFPAPDRRLAFGFAAGRLNVEGGCNRLSGNYALAPGGELKVGRMMGTMMACEPALMQADAAVSRLLAKPLKIELAAGAPPLLRLTSATGDTLSLTGASTPEARYGPGQTVFLEIAPRPVPCNRPLLPGANCLQVRDRHFDKNGLPAGQPGAWRPLYEPIEGFTHREGERNVLRVKRYRRHPAPADASSVVYALDLVVETEIVPR